MGATHFLMKRLHNVKTEMSLAVLACNPTRVMNILGTGKLVNAIRKLLAAIPAITTGNTPMAASHAPYRLNDAKLRSVRNIHRPTACQT